VKGLLDHVLLHHASLPLLALIKELAHQGRPQWDGVG
jgi:hypothetical protein